MPASSRLLSSLLRNAEGHVASALPSGCFALPVVEAALRQGVQVHRWSRSSQTRSPYGSVLNPGFSSAATSFSTSSAPSFALQAQAQAALSQHSNQGDGLTLDASAVQRLRQLQKEQGKTTFLRLEVEGGGCSGFQYKFSLDSNATESDMVFGEEGAQVVCDSVSFDLIRGARIEWEDNLMRSAFVVGANPNSEASCGCGSSFTAKVIGPPSSQKKGLA